jgi:hypothetical protein
MADDKAEIQKEIDSIRADPNHGFNHGDPREQVRMENLYRRLHGTELATVPERRIEGELTADEMRELKERFEKQRSERGDKSDQKAELAEIPAEVQAEVQETFGEVDRLELERGEDPREIDKLIAGEGVKIFPR